ncbi:MAG: UspA4 [uncultured bacterium]|nr:MAG: UspA4 [uncultured bacterium]
MKPEDYKTILFTSNLSTASRIAFRHAALLAHQFHAKLILLHVMERLPSSYEGYMVGLFGQDKVQEVLKRHKQEARHALVGKVTPGQMAKTALSEFYLESGIGEMGADIPKIMIENGEVVEVILKVAEENLCDLIIMGAHEGVMSGTSVGHTIKSTLKKSKIPVLIVPSIGE